MDHKQLMEKLVEMRKDLVADRVKDMAYMEEKGRELLSFRRRGNRVIMSGDKVRLEKVLNTDPVILDYLRSLFSETEEASEMEFVTDENREDPQKYIPKLFCQVGDKKNGWHSKTVERFTTLLLTILSGGQGGKLSMSDKSTPKPAWFCGSWASYINPTSALIEANTDVILGIFKYFDLDPKVHNLFPVHEDLEIGEIGEGLVEDEELGGGVEAGEVQLEQQRLENTPQESADENVEQQQHRTEIEPLQDNNEETTTEVAMEIEVVTDQLNIDERLDDQEGIFGNESENQQADVELETSLNLNISSISDSNTAETHEDSSESVVSGKKKFNLFAKPVKENFVQTIKPRTDNERLKRSDKTKQISEKNQIQAKKQVQEKKKVQEKKQTQEKKTQSKKGKKTIEHIEAKGAKSKRKTKLPAKFLDGLDLSDEESTSHSFIRQLKRQNEKAAAAADPDWSK